MRQISITTAVEGDVLAKDVFVNDVYLFGAGTVISRQRLAILQELNVETIAIQDREQRYGSLKEVFTNIDKRFSYVEQNPLMQHVRMWIKDYISNAYDNET